MGPDESPEQLQKRIERLREELEALGKSELRYRSLFQDNPEVIFVEDLDGNVLSANQRALRATGYSEEELKGLTIFQLFPPEAYADLARQIDEAIQGAQPLTTEQELVRKDGERLCVDLELRILREGSKPVAVQAIAKDCSARRVAEEALKCAHENLERALNGLPDAVLVEDANHVVQFINNAGRALFGSVKGKRCYEVLGLEEVSPTCAVEEIVENRQSLCRTTRRQGDQIWSITGLPLLNADGSTCVLEILRDVTSTRLAEGKLSPPERLVVLARIAREMAHEVKNPLSAITTFAQLLPEKYADEEFREVFTKTAMEAVSKINYLMEEMVNFARPARPVLEETDLKGVLEDVLKGMHPVLSAKKIHVRKDFAPAPLAVAADDQQIKRLFKEVLSNSIDAIEEGGTIALSARIVPAAQEGVPARIDVVVSDSGRGIPPENLPKVFEPFFTTSSEKLGLGLTVAQRIVHEHGGDITVESPPGQGASLTVTLNLA